MSVLRRSLSVRDERPSHREDHGNEAELKVPSLEFREHHHYADGFCRSADFTLPGTESQIPPSGQIRKSHATEVTRIASLLLRFATRCRGGRRQWRLVQDHPRRNRICSSQPPVSRAPERSAVTYLQIDTQPVLHLGWVTLTLPELASNLGSPHVVESGAATR